MMQIQSKRTVLPLKSLSQNDVISLPLPKFSGIPLPLPPAMISSNPFDEFDEFEDFVSA